MGFPDAKGMSADNVPMKAHSPTLQSTECREMRCLLPLAWRRRPPDGGRFCPCERTAGDWAELPATTRGELQVGTRRAKSQQSSLGEPACAPRGRGGAGVLGDTLHRSGGPPPRDSATATG